MKKTEKNSWNIFKACIGILLMLSFTACGVENEAGYTDWDANDNDMIDKNEFHDNLSTRFDDWDINDDDLIDENEFTSFNDNSSVYNEWDADGDNLLNENELADGMFSQWDGNEDGYLEESEYNDNYHSFTED